MIEMCAHHWATNLQPVISAEMDYRQHGSINKFLRASKHEFTDYWEPNYIFRIWFDDPVDEIEFRLKYQIK